MSNKYNIPATHAFLLTDAFIDCFPTLMVFIV